MDTLSTVVKALVDDGRVRRPVLGITFLGGQQAKALGIDAGVLVLAGEEIKLQQFGVSRGLREVLRALRGRVSQFEPKTWPRSLIDFHTRTSRAGGRPRASGGRPGLRSPDGALTLGDVIVDVDGRSINGEADYSKRLDRSGRATRGR